MKKLSLAIPCYNESSTLEKIVEAVLKIESPELGLELLVVDDCSTDDSVASAERLTARHPQIRHGLTQIEDWR